MHDESQRADSRMHHVNLAVPPGGVEAEVDFLVNVIGLTEAVEKKARAAAMFAENELPTPPEPLHWYEDGDGFEVHLTEDPDHQPAKKAHVAVYAGETLQDTEAELGRRGVPATEQLDVPELRVLVTTDPAGNIWELRGHR